VRVRAITAGVALDRLTDRGAVERALRALARARRRFEVEGYEVQTTRVTLPPRLAALDPAARRGALDAVRALDALVTSSGGTQLSVGPVLTADWPDAGLAAWAADLVRATRGTFFSVVVASPARGVHAHAAGVAAAVMRAIAGAVDTGLGSFRFAAAANIPAGTPFFPVGWHDGPSALGIGLESADLVREAFTGAADAEDARRRLGARMTAELREVERVASAIARAEGLLYKGIDPSPAPGGERSIGAALEALTRVPFGGAGTLGACALVTDVLKRLPVRQCGYAGLMLPVLEDTVLARRAVEGRYGLRDLLLFSSVCGTGLDVVPVPGDTPHETLTSVVLDVAALSTALRKPLSARLFLVPGKAAGDPVRFDDPLLTDSVVFRVA
jgi:hypothetical protein